MVASVASYVEGIAVKQEAGRNVVLILSLLLGDAWDLLSDGRLQFVVLRVVLGGM